ncbi:hypothetical protein [Nocardioides litoris]|uniref:hypothetical protein n=1 Tax=Nocardioides litoris TaxID=1926648 RepID=UPI001121E183|nr:hypothetical protein [Nocardioides litoris]
MTSTGTGHAAEMDVRIDPDAVRAAGRHADDAERELATARLRAVALADAGPDLGDLGLDLARAAGEVRDLLDGLSGTLATHRDGLADGAAAMQAAEHQTREDVRAAGR